MRSKLTTAAEVAGMGSITAGLWMVAVPLGLMALGAALLVIGISEGRR